MSIADLHKTDFLFASTINFHIKCTDMPRNLQENVLDTKSKFLHQVQNIPWLQIHTQPRSFPMAGTW